MLALGWIITWPLPLTPKVAEPSSALRNILCTPELYPNNPICWFVVDFSLTCFTPITTPVNWLALFFLPAPTCGARIYPSPVSSLLPSQPLILLISYLLYNIIIGLIWIILTLLPETNILFNTLISLAKEVISLSIEEILEEYPPLL